MREFQSLRAVDSHKPHLIARIVEISVCEQRDVRQIMLERAFLAAGRLVGIDRLLEFGQIVQPHLAALRAEHGLIAAFVQNGGQQFGNRHLIINAGERFDQRDKFPVLRPAQQFTVQIPAQCVVKRAAVLRGIVLQKRHAALAKVPLGYVRNAQERQVVPAGDHAQITQRVLDFSTGEELHAAVDRVRDFFLQEKFLHAARDIVRAV